MWNYRLCPPTLRPPSDIRDIWSVLAAMAVYESCTAAPGPGTGWHLPWWAVRHVRHNTGWPQTWINYPPECSVQMTPGQSVHCGLHHVLLSTRLSFIQLNTFKTSSWVDGYNLHNIIFYVRYLPCLRFLVKNFSENCKMPKFHGASAWPEMDSGHFGAAP